MYEDKPRAVSEQPPQVSVIVEDDEGVIFLGVYFTMDVIEYQPQERKHSLQSLAQGVAIKERMAHQFEAAASHRMTVDTEEFVIQQIRQLDPQASE
jgi:hypothetical protein